MRPAEGVAYEKLSAQKGGQAFAVQAFFRERFLEVAAYIAALGPAQLLQSLLNSIVDAKQHVQAIRKVLGA
jgi:hypothetical protein